MTQLTTDSLVDEFERSTQIAQIFSGAFFGMVVMYMVFSNSTKLAFIQQASQEKRLAMCCNIGIGVAAISCFLSVFQITEVDNHVLPSRTGYTVDLARPVEWILTCPLMQLTLVLMGGARIPEYRRLLMPFFSAAIVGCGSLSLFVEGFGKWCCYASGLTLFGIMTYFNRLQIIEHSNGTEGFWRGESEFRKATLILILTWIPFPVWYSLSPEGFDIIDNVLVIQMGWMFLNIIAKGSSILYIQRSKDNYIARLKVNKLMKNQGATQRMNYDEEGERADTALRPCVAETLTYLGMADKTERFLKLLKDAKIYGMEELEALTPRECEKKKLPFDLITAVQKRQKNWKLEVRDDAEEGLEKGEDFYANSRRISVQEQLDPGSPLISKPPPPPPPGTANTRQMNQLQQAGKSVWGDEPSKSESTAPCPASNEELLNKLLQIEERLQAMSLWEDKLDNGVSMCVNVCQSSLDRGLDSVDRHLKHVDNSLQNLGDCLDTSLKGISSSISSISSINSMQRSGGVSGEHLEIAFSNQDKRTQCLQEDLQSRLDQVSKQLTDQKLVMSQAKGEVVDKVEESVKAWAQQIMTDARANMYTIQNGIAAMDDAVQNGIVAMGDAQVSNQEVSQNVLVDRIQDRLKSVMEASQNVLVDRIQDRLKSDMGNLFETLESENAKDRQRSEEVNSDALFRLSTEIDTLVEKHVKVGVGVLTNNFRGHVEILQDSQVNIENRLSLQMDNTKSDIFETSTQLWQKCQSSLQSDFNDQKQICCSVLEQAAGAQIRSKECLEILTNISDRLSSTSAALATTRAPTQDLFQSLPMARQTSTDNQLRRPGSASAFSRRTSQAVEQAQPTQLDVPRGV